MSAKPATKVAAKKVATKVPAKKAAGKKPAYKPGDLAVFIGYQGLAEGEDRVIVNDDVFVKIEAKAEVGKKGFKYNVSVVSEDPEDLDAEGALPQDQVYESELRPLEGDEEAQAAEILASLEGGEPQGDLSALGKQADGGDEDAQARLTALAGEHDIDPDQYDTWVEVADLIKAKTSGAPGKGRGKGAKQEVEEVHVSASVKKLLKGGDAHEAAVALNSRINQAWFDFGGLLLIINRDKSFAALNDPEGNPYTPDKEGFDAYVKNEFDVNVSTAYHWMRIHNAMSLLGKGHDALKGIGWDKAMYIAQALKANAFVMEDEAFTSLVEYAKENNRADLKMHVDNEYINVEPGTGGGGGGGGTRGGKGGRMTKSRVSFILFGDQAAGVVASAVEAAKAATGQDDDGQALVHICTEWGQLSEQDIPLELAVSALEARYGCKVEITQQPEKKKGKGGKAKPATKVAAKKAAKKAK